MTETCVICESEVKVKHDKAVLAECEKCGVVPRRKSLIAGLIELGVKEDAIGLLQMCNREVLQEIITKVRYGTPFLVKLIAYEYFLLNGRNEEAQELLKKIGKRKKINMFRKYHSELFGKKVCLNDCMINMFIEVASRFMSEEVLKKCLEILKKMSAQRTIYKSDLAAVLYYFTPLAEGEVAKIFGITDVSVRNAIRRQSYMLARELFNFIVDGYVDEQDKAYGIGIILSLASARRLSKRDVKRAVEMYNGIPEERIKMFFRAKR
jgi:hypothetical protein